MYARSAPPSGAMQERYLLSAAAEVSEKVCDQIPTLWEVAAAVGVSMSVQPPAEVEGWKSEVDGCFFESYCRQMRYDRWTRSRLRNLAGKVSAYRNGPKEAADPTAGASVGQRCSLLH